MVGTQDDQNAGAQLSGEKAPYYGHYSNQTAEFDIIETYLAPLEKMKAWRPVIHPNGSNEIEYLWAPESEIPGDPSSEYHIYGFEWDENGTKFYVDNKLVNETDRSPNYRMMTIFSVYATGGMGRMQASTRRIPTLIISVCIRKTSPQRLQHHHQWR